MKKPKLKNSIHPFFCEPKLNQHFVEFVWWLLPAFKKFALNKLTVEFDQELLAEVKNLHNKNLFLISNHPTNEDPYVYLDLSRELQLSVNAIAARETFDWEGGVRGLGFQWLGCYSLVRGAADRESFMTTKKLLTEGLRPLLVFIEGEVTNQNEVLLPFESGVVALAFKAQEELAAKNTQQSVHLLPAAIKYKYAPGVEIELHKALAKLEEATHCQFDAGKTMIERFAGVGQKILQVHEKRLSLTTAPEEPFTERINKVKNKILCRIETFLEITPIAFSSELDRVRVIRNALDKICYVYDETEKLSVYETRLLAEEFESIKEFYSDLERLVNFLVFDGEYLSRHNTPERCVELVRRLEKEVFGEVKFSFARTAHVVSGSPIALADSFDEYKQNKKQVVSQITQQIQDTMNSLLI